MREYKLKIDSSKTYLVDSDPTKVVESFLDTLPEKNSDKSNQDLLVKIK